jgi:ABC-type Fe3+/spermidine/putrescine transport system ATPase subunit
MARVVLEGLTKRFGEVGAVRGADLTIEDGQFVSLLGPSGCGKTTTLRLLAGFQEPDAGRILVDGKVLSEPGRVVPPERRSMAMIFQSYAIWPHKTVFENVAFGLRLRKVQRRETEDRVNRILGLVRLHGLSGRYPGELSGGQQQRVALARSLVVEPQILLLDEPLSNLDANLREEMRFEIRRLHDEFRITTVYVTHDQAEAMVTSDRIAVMHEGRMEQIGSPEDIYERPQTQFVAGFIGRTNCLKGRITAPDRVACSGVVLSVRDAGTRVEPGNEVVVSIRPQAIAIGPKGGGEGCAGLNVFEGRVVRQVYLGEARDYLVGVAGTDITLRVATSARQAFQPGEVIRLTVAPEECRVIPA